MNKKITLEMSLEKENNMKTNENNTPKSLKLDELKNAVLSNLWALQGDRAKEDKPDEQKQADQKNFNEFIKTLRKTGVLTQDQKSSIGSAQKKTKTQELTDLIEKADLTDTEWVEFKEFCANIETCRLTVAKGANTLDVFSMKPLTDAVNVAMSNKEELLPLVEEKKENEVNYEVSIELEDTEGDIKRNSEKEEKQEEKRTEVENENSGHSVQKVTEVNNNSQGEMKTVNWEVLNDNSAQKEKEAGGGAELIEEQKEIKNPEQLKEPENNTTTVTETEESKDEQKQETDASQEQLGKQQKVRELEEKSEEKKKKKLKRSKVKKSDSTPSVETESETTEVSGAVEPISKIMVSLYSGCEKGDDKCNLVTEFINSQKANSVNDKNIDNFIASAKLLDLAEDITKTQLTLDQAHELKSSYTEMQTKFLAFLMTKSQSSDGFNLEPVGVAIDKKIIKIKEKQKTVEAALEKTTASVITNPLLAATDQSVSVPPPVVEAVFKKINLDKLGGDTLLTKSTSLGSQLEVQLCLLVGVYHDADEHNKKLIKEFVNELIDGKNKFIRNNPKIADRNNFPKLTEEQIDGLFTKNISLSNLADNKKLVPEIALSLRVDINVLGRYFERFLEDKKQSEENRVITNLNSIRDKLVNVFGPFILYNDFSQAYPRLKFEEWHDYKLILSYLYSQCADEAGKKSIENYINEFYTNEFYTNAVYKKLNNEEINNLLESSQNSISDINNFDRARLDKFAKNVQDLKVDFENSLSEQNKFTYGNSFGLISKAISVRKELLEKSSQTGERRGSSTLPHNKRPPLNRPKVALVLNVVNFGAITYGVTLMSQRYLGPVIINRTIPWLYTKGLASVVPALTYQVQGINLVFAALSLVGVGLILPKVSDRNKTDDTRMQSLFLTLGALAPVLYCAYSAYAFNGFSHMPTLTNGRSVQSVVPMIVAAAVVASFVINSWNKSSAIRGGNETLKDLGIRGRKYQDGKLEAITNVVQHPGSSKDPNFIILGGMLTSGIVAALILRKGVLNYALPFARSYGYDLISDKNANTIASIGCAAVALAMVVIPNRYASGKIEKCSDSDKKENAIAWKNLANFTLGIAAAGVAYGCFNSKIPATVPAITLAAAVAFQYIYCNNISRSFTGAVGTLKDASGISAITG